jgi:hypothetical protein
MLDIYSDVMDLWHKLSLLFVLQFNVCVCFITILLHVFLLPSFDLAWYQETI